jgi:hypothetical protein
MEVKKKKRYKVGGGRKKLKCFCKKE